MARSRFGMFVWRIGFVLKGIPKREFCLRLLQYIQSSIDKQIEAIVSKGWSPTGKDGSCDPSCDHCGYLCPRCGRP